MNTLLEKSQKWLNELGVRTELTENILKVNKNDMVNLLFGEWESQYEEILSELRKELNTVKLFWGGKDDTWLFLDCF